MKIKLTDINTAGASGGQVITFNGSVPVWATPTGGGGGGSGGTLGHAFANDANSQASSLLADGSPIPGLTTSFTLTAATDVYLHWSILLRRTSGSINIVPIIDGTAFRPTATSDTFHAISVGESNVLQAAGGYTVNLAAGVHTIALNYNDALTVNSVVFTSRSLRVSS